MGLGLGLGAKSEQRHHRRSIVAQEEMVTRLGGSGAELGEELGVDLGRIWGGSGVGQGWIRGGIRGGGQEWSRALPPELFFPMGATAECEPSRST